MTSFIDKVNELLNTCAENFGEEYEFIESEKENLVELNDIFANNIDYISPIDIRIMITEDMKFSTELRFDDISIENDSNFLKDISDSDFNISIFVDGIDIVIKISSSNSVFKKRDN